MLPTQARRVLVTRSMLCSVTADPEPTCFGNYQLYENTNADGGSAIVDAVLLEPCLRRCEQNSDCTA